MINIKKRLFSLEEVITIVLMVSGVVAFFAIQFGITVGHGDGYSDGLSNRLGVTFNATTNIVETTVYLHDWEKGEK